jgi:hypothetical protein
MITLLEKPDVMEAFVQAQMNPLCGWLWLSKNRFRQHPEQTISISYNGKAIFDITSSKMRPGLIRAAMKMARGTNGKKKND